jgi:hypothetical protein
MKSQDSKLENGKVSVRVKLAGLWIALMLLYIYCDIYSFHRTGYINEIIAGRIGFFEVSQGILAAFGALMAIPALMIPACLFLKTRAVRCVNIVIGILYLLVNIGNLAGEAWAYYWIYGVLEIGVTVGVIIVAAKWRKESAENG